MNLNGIIDLFLGEFYDQFDMDDRKDFSKVMAKYEIPYDRISAELISTKLKSLPYWRTDDYGYTEIKDMVMASNLAGYEFYQQYGTYTNYLKLKEQEVKQAEVVARRSATGSYLSGIGAIVAIPLSIASLVYTYTKDQKQERNIESLSDSLRTTEIKLKAVEKNIRTQPKAPAQTYSQIGLKKK